MMMKQINSLSHSDAVKIVNALRESLERENQGAAVAVVDAHGELMAFVRTDGCPLASINNAINKAFTSARERRESRAVGDAARADNFPLTNFGDLRYIGWGGGAPIIVNDECIGAVGVSGLPEQVDMELARTGAGLIG
jgi:glc operon protein GlcG